MKENRKVYLFMSCNEKWISHLTVSINSAKSHTSRNLHLFFCIKDENREMFFRKILEWFESCNFSFEILIPKSSHLQLLFDGKVTRFPIECYYRLLIGSLVPKYVKKVIYLDADTIIDWDIGDLYDLDILTTIAGVQDIYWWEYFWKLLSTNFWVSISTYINAGVILINLEKFRENNNQSKMLATLKNDFTKLPNLDQDLINLVFHSDITLLEAWWNLQILYGVIPKNIQHIYIYHVYWRPKADSSFYYNRDIQLIYSKYLGIKTKNNIFHYWLYFLFIFPLKRFLFIKTKLYFQSPSIQKKELLSIFWVLYPPVTVIIMFIIFKTITKIGIKKFAVKLLQLFRLETKFYT